MPDAQPKPTAAEVPFTPTDEEMRYVYARNNPDAADEWDRWLAEHDDAVRLEYEKRRSATPVVIENIQGTPADQWLAEHDAQVLRDAADEVEASGREQVRTYSRWRDHRAAVLTDQRWKADVALLRARAGRIAGVEQP